MTQLAFGQIAPISRRAVAYVIDALIAGGLGIVLCGVLITAAVLTGSPEGILSVLAIGGPLVSLALLGWMLAYTAMQTGKGSIGMRAQGVRLADAATGTSVGFWRALLRNIVFGLAGSIVVGYFSPLFDGSGRYQGWHDKAAKSLVLNARASAGPATTAMPVVAPVHTPVPPRPQPMASVAPLFPPGAPTPMQTAPQFPGVPPVPTAAPAAPAMTPQPIPPRPSAAPVAPAQAPSSAQPAPAADSPLIAFVPGVTQDTPPVRPAPAVPAPAVAPAPVAPAAAPIPAAAPDGAAPVDEGNEDIEETRISIPGHRLVFTWDDGTRVSVSRRTIFGRNPADDDGALLVPVRDETLSLSKTHFETAAAPSGGWVRDLHSTNGLTIVRDGQRIPCTPGEKVPVRLGDAIEIGDRIVTIGGYE